MTKILLVEDDKSLREIYGVRLLAEGYDIVSAGDGEDALAMAIKERPDLIISDVMMPKISGFDMLDILRSTTETRDIKVIMMTALSSDDQRARGEQLGADRYLVKSQVGIEDVVRTVHEVMNDAGKTQAPAAAESATPAPEPAPSAEPVAPTPEPTPAPTTQSPSTLPQPTAPFSSPKPDNLGERVINPIEKSDSEPSLETQIQNELASITPAEPQAPQSTAVAEPTAFAAPQPITDSAAPVDDTSSSAQPAEDTLPSPVISEPIAVDDDLAATTAPEPTPAPEVAPETPAPTWQAPAPVAPAAESTATPSSPQDEQQRTA